MVHCFWVCVCIQFVSWKVLLDDSDRMIVNATVLNVSSFVATDFFSLFAICLSIHLFVVQLIYSKMMCIFRSQMSLKRFNHQFSFVDFGLAGREVATSATTATRLSWAWMVCASTQRLQCTIAIWAILPQSAYKFDSPVQIDFISVSRLHSLCFFGCAHSDVSYVGPYSGISGHSVYIYVHCNDWSTQHGFYEKPSSTPTQTHTHRERQANTFSMMRLCVILNHFVCCLVYFICWRHFNSMFTM